MLCAQILKDALALVTGSRQTQNGDKRENHENIAAVWNAFLFMRTGARELLTASDVALMMVLFKVARTQSGQHNLDDYVDAVGYSAIAGDIAAQEEHDPQPDEPVDMGELISLDEVYGNAEKLA